MNAIIEDLVKDHQRFRIFLSRYEREVEALRSGDPDYAMLGDLAEYFCLFPDELHHRKEDVIYDVITEIEDERAASPSQGNARLRDLRAAHAQISATAETFREGVEQATAGGQLPREELAHHASTYIMVQRRHMQEEEAAFFPRALSIDDEKIWARIHARIADALAENVNIIKAREILTLEKSLLSQLA